MVHYGRPWSITSANKKSLLRCDEKDSKSVTSFRIQVVGLGAHDTRVCEFYFEYWSRALTQTFARGEMKCGNFMWKLQSHFIYNLFPSFGSKVATCECLLAYADITILSMPSRNPIEMKSTRKNRHKLIVRWIHSMCPCISGGRFGRDIRQKSRRWIYISLSLGVRVSPTSPLESCVC